MTDGIKSTVTSKICDVSRVERNRKSDGKPFVIFEVETEDGTKWQTFDASVGNLADTNRGRVAEMKVTIKKNGDYVNYYLDSLIITGPPVEDDRKVEIARNESPEVDFATFAAHDQAKQAAKDLSIHRQVAAKVAAALAEPGTTATEFWGNVSELLNFFQTGAVPLTINQAVAQVLEERSSVTSNTASQTEVPPPHGDSDIPFPDDDNEIPF